MFNTVVPILALQFPISLFLILNYFIVLFWFVIICANYYNEIYQFTVILENFSISIFRKLSIYCR